MIYSSLNLQNFLKFPSIRDLDILYYENNSLLIKLTDKKFKLSLKKVGLLKRVLNWIITWNHKILNALICLKQVRNFNF